MAEVISGGIGGTQMAQIGLVREVAVGPFVLRDVPTTFVKTERGSFNTKAIAGNIGAGIFARFRVITDMTRGQLHLEADAERLAAPFERDRAGLYLHADEGRVAVLHVVPGSAADAAELKKGDVVTAIASKPVTQENWAELARESFRQAAGTTVKVTLADGREVPLTLSDYY
jgi:hypothetical protein